MIQSLHGIKQITLSKETVNEKTKSYIRHLHIDSDNGFEKMHFQITLFSEKPIKIKRAKK